MMATSLTTPKMSPELAARVEASVRQGRRTTPGARWTAHWISMLRLGVAVLLLAGLSAIAIGHQRELEQMEQERASLLSAVRSEVASVEERQRTRVLAIPQVLERASRSYPGDLLTPEIRGEAAFHEQITRPALYVRGPLARFRRPEEILSVTASSYTDAFTLCLVDPPGSRSEKALLSRARSALARGERLERATSHIESLHDALLGLSFLAPEWLARVEATENRLALQKLRRAFESAPLASAKKALRSEMLWFVIDEPGEGPGPTELDGERAHPVRVGLFDLASQKMHLLLRRPVDPSWISPAARAEHARGIDSCSLALDVRGIAIGTFASNE